MRHNQNVEILEVTARDEWLGGEKWIKIRVKEDFSGTNACLPHVLMVDGVEYGLAHYLDDTRSAGYSTRHRWKYK